MSVQKKNNTQFKRQVVYLGSENCNSEYTDLGRNPNSGLIIEEGIREFYRKKKKKRKMRSVVLKKISLVLTNKARFVLHWSVRRSAHKVKDHFYQSFGPETLILADTLECWWFGSVQRFRKQDTQDSSSGMSTLAPFKMTPLMLFFKK